MGFSFFLSFWKCNAGQSRENGAWVTETVSQASVRPKERKLQRQKVNDGEADAGLDEIGMD